jgi:hypothetical protein
VSGGRPFATLGDRRKVSSVLSIADRKKLPDTRGLAPARKSSGTGFLLGFMFGFAACAVVLAIAMTVL